MKSFYEFVIEKYTDINTTKGLFAKKMREESTFPRKSKNAGVIMRWFVWQDIVEDTIQIAKSCLHNYGEYLKVEKNKADKADII